MLVPASAYGDRTFENATLSVGEHYCWTADTAQECFDNAVGNLEDEVALWQGHANHESVALNEQQERLDEYDEFVMEFSQRPGYPGMRALPDVSELRGYLEELEEQNQEIVDTYSKTESQIRDEIGEIYVAGHGRGDN